MQVSNNSSGGKESTFSPFLRVPPFNEHGTTCLNSTAKGTKADNVVISKTKIHPIRTAFFMHVVIFRQAEKLGLKRSHFLPKEETSSTKSHWASCLLRQFCKSKYHTIYLPLLQRGPIFYHNSCPLSDSQVIHIAQGTKRFIVEENQTDCFTVAGTEKDALLYCTGDETVMWATLTAEHFLRRHSQDSSLALCCSVPNRINGDTSTRWVTKKVSVALLLVICLIKGT